MEHIIKNSQRNDCSPATTVEDVAGRYINFIDKICSLGYTTLIYGPAFSGFVANSHGAQVERNACTIQFNKTVHKECKKRSNAYFTAIDDIAIDQKTLKSRMELSEDGRHLDFFPEGSAAIQAIIFSRFHKETVYETEAIEKRVSKDFRRVRKDFANGKPYFIFNPKIIKRNPTKDEGNARVSTGIITPEMEIDVKSTLDDPSSFTIDLLDHYGIEDITITFNQTGKSQASTIEVETTSIKENIAYEPVDLAHIEQKNGDQQTIRIATGRKISRSLTLVFKSTDEIATTVTSISANGAHYEYRDGDN